MDETQNNNLLQTVEQVFSKVYTIPEYQRGYKWTAETVGQLLRDISAFEPEGESFYCLQNITVIKSGNGYEVIDGQQRLTTLAILLAYLGKGEGLAEKLNYALREESGEFLRRYVFETQTAHSYYDAEKGVFKGPLPDEKYDRQDIFHFAQAAYIINQWVDPEQDFAGKLLKHVKLIVNNISDGVKEKIFANLNAHKVPLTPADLIRAILITRSTANAEGLVALNERRVRLGWELDQFHQWWLGAPTLLFSHFLRPGKDEAPKDLKAMGGIEVLYRLYYNYNREESKQNAEWLSTKGIQQRLEQDTEVYDDYQGLRSFHHAMQDWFEDGTLYHYLGFLAFHSSLTIKNLWQEWERVSSRNDFILYLKGQILQTVFDALQTGDKPKKPSTKEQLEYLSAFLDEEDTLYGEQKNFLSAVLVLMDVIGLTESNKGGNKEREIRRLPLGYFGNNGEDIEHIFCQTPNEGDQEAFYEALLKEFPGLHSVGNLLLLNSGVNRSYGNDEYLKKRDRILEEYQKGVYIRPHTLSAFTKSFGGAENLQAWGPEDIKNNACYIKKSIQNFFEGGQ